MRSRSTERRRAAAGVGGALLLLAACARPSSSPDAVVAVHARGEVTRAELEAWIERLKATDDWPPPERGNWRVAVLESFVVRDILAQEAVEQPGLAAAAAKATEAALAAAMRRHLDWDRAADAATARAYYEAHRERFARPERLRLQHLFLRAEVSERTAAERADVRRRLEAIRREAVAGAEFGDLVQAHSDSADAAGGGWMVLQRDTRVVRAFADAVWALEPGEVSPPIDTATGFHLVRLAARIPAAERPFAEVAEEATREATAARRRALESDYLREVGPRHGLRRSYHLLQGPVREDAVLFSLVGETFTLGDLLRRLPDLLLPHVYAGHLQHLEPQLDRHALDRLLVREARASGFAVTTDARRRMEIAVNEVRADVEIERRLRERAAGLPAAELRRMHGRDRQRYQLPRRRSLSVIRLAPERDELLWSLLRRAERAVAAIRGGADFAAAGRFAGGVVYAGDERWVGWTDDELRRRVFAQERDLARLAALQVGEVSDPFVGDVLDPSTGRFDPACVYILRLDEITPARPLRFAEAADLIRADYLRGQRRRLLAELEREVLATADLRFAVDDLAGFRR